MPGRVKNYGVWVAKPTHMKAERANIDSRSPHIQLTFTDNAGNHRAAINVKSTDRHESRLVYWLNRQLKHSITDHFQNLHLGFRPLHDENGLDYIRQKLVRIEDGAVLPHDEAGPNNDIIDEVAPILQDGIDRKATIYIFGSMFADNGTTNGRGSGIHDIHMNQGSLPRFDNGTYQDGAIFLHFDDDDHWECVFLAFASQRIPTWDDSGKPKHDAQELVEIIENAGGDVEGERTDS
jgi:uncharacterized protein YukJ